MKYFIDTAAANEIEKWSSFVEGATCNPSLLEKAGIDAYTFYKNNAHMFKNIFVQINSMNQIKTLIENGNISKNQLVFKVPLLITRGFNGFALLKALNKSKLRTCATIVYDVSQFDYACEVGSEFSIVLYAKNDNNFIINECCHLKEKRGYETKVVAASFRSAEHVCECMKAGADYATVPPKILREIFSNSKAIEDYNKFYGLE